MVLLDGEFKYESNGSFGSENELKRRSYGKNKSGESDRESDTWSQWRYCSNHCSAQKWPARVTYGHFRVPL